MDINRSISKYKNEDIIECFSIYLFKIKEEPNKHKIMKNLTIVTMFLAMFCFASSCEKDEITTAIDFDLNENVEIKYEQLAQLNEVDLQLMVVEVLEDSRCPINAQCIWAGQVRLNLEVIYQGIKSYEEITFLGNEHTQLVKEEYLIQLKNVTPEVEVDELIELDDYTFTFLVTEQ